MIYCFDLDGTICSSVYNSDYESARPNYFVISGIKHLRSIGHTIIIDTARGSVSGIDYTELTKSQLDDWMVPYDELIMNHKPNADYYIDDKAVNVSDWKKSQLGDFGILAGAFDIIHPGYIRMISDAKIYCKHLTIALNVAPEGKMVPVQSVEDRMEVLLGLKGVDDVVVYESEEELYQLLENGAYEVRFIGADHIGEEYTGWNLPIRVKWVEREHGYSSTKLKESIAKAMPNA